MSGICGIVNFDGSPVDPDVLRTMTEAVAYRGPDGIHYWIEGNVGLAHLALHSTPEALREHQPLVNRRGDLVLTADARVDNRPELISTLTAKRYIQDKDPTDADLILAAYDCWGEACPEHIIGDFAFAVWDKRERKLFCARDALGVRMLHYTRSGKNVFVATEAQQLLQHPDVPCRLDEIAVADYLVNNCKDQERTMFLDVRKIPPAHCVVSTETDFVLSRYWDIDPKHRIRYRNDDEYAAHFLELFRRSVADHLRTQGDAVGIFMSGGMDSTSIAAVAQQKIVQNNLPAKLVAYSYAFEQLKECDERVYIQAMSDALGFEVKYVNMENFWLFGDDDAFRPSLETPFAGWASSGRYVFDCLQQQNGRVVFTGHGGDSLVLGNQLAHADEFAAGDFGIIFRMARRARAKGAPCRQLFNEYYQYIIRPLARRVLQETLMPVLKWLFRYRPRQPRVPTWVNPAFAERAGLSVRGSFNPTLRRFRSQVRQTYYEKIVNLGAVGRAVYWYEREASQFRLEARHPFLDRRLAEYVLAIPTDQMFHGGRRKAILRHAMTGIMPAEVRQRQDKTIFDRYVQTSLCETAVKIHDLFETPILGQLNIINAQQFGLAYANYCAGQNQGFGKQLYLALSLELWLKQYFAIFRTSYPIKEE